MIAAGRFALWAPVGVQMALIFIASSIPNLKRLPGDISDHTGHFVGYALLAVLLQRALAGGRWAGVGVASAAWAWIGAVLYGLTDEFHQRFVPGRTAAFDDLVADALGAGVVLLLAWCVGRIRRGRTRAV